MNKTIKVIYLLMMLLIVNTCVAFAQSEEKNTQTYNWQAFDIGPAEDYNYAFDTNSIKYAKNEDGSINKNIIIYQEKKINNDSPSSGERTGISPNHPCYGMCGVVGPRCRKTFSEKNSLENETIDGDSPVFEAKRSVVVS